MRVPIQASIERAWRDVAAIEAAFAQGEIDEAEWHARMARLCVPAYLAGQNPRAQSGYSGTEAELATGERARRRRDPSFRFVSRHRLREWSLVEHLLGKFLLPNGRLLIGSYSEERDETRVEPSLEDEMRSWGFAPTGRIERPHSRDDRVVRRLIYVDQP